MLVFTRDLWIQVSVGHSQRRECISSIFLKGTMKHNGFRIDAKVILKAVEFLICLTVSWIKQSLKFLLILSDSNLNWKSSNFLSMDEL